MNLRSRKMYPWSPDLPQVRDLYLRSFPEYERIPFQLLMALTVRRCSNLYAIYDSQVLCGLACLISTPDMLYLYYLAVDPTLRSHGYGSAILEWVKEKAAGQQVVLDMETAGPGFENSDQRERRQSFYFRNGFSDTGYRAVDEGCLFDILSTDAEGFRPEQFLDLVRLASLGLKKEQVVSATCLGRESLNQPIRSSMNPTR